VITYTFKVVVEPDEDAWYAYCPALVGQGGATWGSTRAEALANIDEVIKMVLASMIKHGEPIPDDSTGGPLRVSEEHMVAVTV
jgi:predicted RNase H-like HicB family nuclease